MQGSLLRFPSQEPSHSSLWNTQELWESGTALCTEQWLWPHHLLSGFDPVLFLFKPYHLYSRDKNCTGLMGRPVRIATGLRLER